VLAHWTLIADDDVTTGGASIAASFSMGVGPFSAIEKLVVVAVLPRGEVAHGRIKVPPGVTIPELLVIDAMAAFDLAVLLRPSWLDVTDAHTEFLAPQRKRQRELGPIDASAVYACAPPRRLVTRRRV
jgi:hypothetical protein